MFENSMEDMSSYIKTNYRLENFGNESNHQHWSKNMNLNTNKE